MNSPDPPSPAAGKPGHKIWRVAAKFLLLFFTLSICALLFEITARRLLPWARPQAQIPFRFDPAHGIGLGGPGQTVRQATPKGDYDSFIHFNQDGLRDSRDLRQATEADWFAIGDSFTLGWGVEEPERYSNQLEQLLNTNGFPERVFNVAMPDNIIGYQRLLKYAESRGPVIRHIIIGICMENDLRDYRDGRSSWDLESDANSQSTHLSPRQWFRAHSALYIAASYALEKFSAIRQLLEKVGVARDIEQTGGKNDWNETVLTTSRDEVVKLAAGRDAFVLIIPSRHLWKGDNQPTEKRVHETFVRLLRDAGLRVVDPSSAIEAGGSPLNFYFKTDPHWNSRGHALAARQLFNSIHRNPGSL